MKPKDESFFGCYGSEESVRIDVGGVLTPEIIQEAFDREFRCIYCGLVDMANGRIYEAVKIEYSPGYFFRDYHFKGPVCDKCFKEKK